jgi:hypothetical protein
VIQKLSGWRYCLQVLPNINIISNPKTPVPLGFLISNFDDHIRVMGMFLFTPELAAFGGMVNENEGCTGIVLPEIP